MVADPHLLTCSRALMDIGNGLRAEKTAYSESVEEVPAFWEGEAQKIYMQKSRELVDDMDAQASEIHALSVAVGAYYNKLL